METERRIKAPIGVNGYFLTQPPCGSRQYVEHIMNAWAGDHETADHTMTFTIEKSENRNTTILSPIWKRNDILRKALFERSVALAASRTCALLWSPYHAISAPSVPYVMTVHDAIGYLPEWNTNRNGRTRLYAEQAKRAARRAQRIITPSNDAKRDIMNALDIDPAKITVIPNGIDHATYRPLSPQEQQQTRERFHLPEKYACYVGGFERRKNVEFLLSLFKATPERTLVIIGNLQKIEKNTVFSQAMLPPNIAILQGINDLDKARILASAHTFLWPSAKEGFGLPPLEAAACGTPVIALRTSCTPEVLGSAALWCKRTEVEEWKAALDACENTETCEEYRKRGIAQAAKFSWNTTAEQTWTALLDVINENL